MPDLEAEHPRLGIYSGCHASDDEDVMELP